MLVSFEDLEKTTKLCTIVFHTWDYEYKKLLGQMRDLAMRKRDETIKMVLLQFFRLFCAWHINPSHKRLQIRLDAMQK